MSASIPAANLPSILAAAVAGLVAVTIWHTVRMAGANDALRRELAERRAPAVPAAVPSGKEAAAELAAIQAELEQARDRLRTAEAEAGKLAESLAVTPADELKSYGRVEELAAGGARLLAAIQEMPKAKHDAELAGRRLDPAAFLQDLPGLIVSTEAIGQLEENPPQVAELHAYALHTMLGLDQETVRRVRGSLAVEFEALRQQGFSRPQRPAAGQEEWYARRDEILLEAATRVEALIPQQHRKCGAVAEAMNLGTAFRSRAMRVAGVAAGGMQLYYQAPGSEPITF